MFTGPTTKKHLRKILSWSLYRCLLVVQCACMNVVYTTMYIPPKVTFFSFLFSYCTIDRLIVTVQTPFRFSTTIIISRHKKYHCATSLSFSLNCGQFRTKTLISKQTTDTWLSKRISYQSLLRNDYPVKLIGNIFFSFYTKQVIYI